MAKNRFIYVFTLSFICASFLAVFPIAHAATGDISAVRILGDTAHNGWTAEIDIAGLSKGGAYNFGLGANNNPTNAKVVFTVTSQGFDATGATTTIQRTIYGTDWVRRPYPNDSLADEATSTGIVTVRVSLSDFIYQKDTNITATIASGFYTQGGTPNNAISNISVTNNSVLAYPKTIANWSYPGWSRITGSSFTVRAVAFNRSAQQGLPVRVVKFFATDQHGHTVSTLVTSPTVDNSLGDASKVVEYIGTLSTASLTPKDLITINFVAYPWVGDTGATMDTSDGVNSQPTPLYAPIYGVYDDGTYGTAAAVVDASAGNDTTCTAVAESAFSSSTPPSACATIDKAASIINAYNNAHYSRNDAAGTIYLKAGTYNWAGSSNTISATVSNVWSVITPFPGVSGSSAVIGGQSGDQSFGGTKIKFENVTINVTSSPVSVFNGITYLWFDHCFIGMNGVAPIYNVNDWYITDSTSTLAELFPFSSVDSSPALIRGNNVTGAVQGMVYTVLGNTNTSLGSMAWQNEIAGTSAPTSTEPIFAYNTFYKLANASDYTSFFGSVSNPLGAAIIQNLFEYDSTGGLPNLWIAADSTTNSPVNNVMLWYNTLVGGRLNRAYNSTGSSSIQRTLWSERGNITDTEHIKSDTFTSDGGANAARTGNWDVLYGVGKSGSYDNESTPLPAAGGFQMEFGGINSYVPASTGGQPPSSQTNALSTIGYVDREAYDGVSAHSGGGNYELTGSSPAIAMVPSALAMLPYDLAGNARHTSTNGAAGAYEYVDTVAPSVTIISPSNGAAVSSTVTFTASSTDNVAVQSVAFYAGGTLIGSSAVASGTQYSVSWNTTLGGNGSTTLMAISTDTNNNTSSVSIVVNVQNPAILQIATSTNFAFTASVGSVTTSSQTMVVKNIGPTGSTLNWSASSTQTWLTFSVASSSLAGSATSPVLVIVDPSGKSAGTYNATVTITDPNASQSPQSFSVALTVNPAGNVTPTPPAPSVIVGVPSSYGSPNYWLTPTSSVATPVATTTAPSVVSATSVATSSPTSPSFRFLKNLAPGAKNLDVQRLQEFLNRHGFMVASQGPGSLDEETQYFGLLTQKAVEKFQKTYGIVSSGSPATTGYGVAGPRTRAKLNSL